MGTREERLTGYLVSLVAVGIAALLRLMLGPLLGDSAPYMTFFAATVFAAWFAGSRPGYVAAVTGGTLAYLAYGTPKETSGAGISELLALGLFLALNVFIARLTSSLRSASARAEANRAALAESEDFPKLYSSLGNLPDFDPAHG